MPTETQTRENKDEKIISHMTQSAFLHFMDATEIGKVKLFAGHYKRGEGADQTARHYVDIRTFRPILHDLSWGKTVDFVDFKGSEKGSDGQPESRVLKIRSGKDKKDRDAIFLTLQAGPGAVVGEGAVKPAGPPTTEVNIVLPAEARSSPASVAGTPHSTPSICLVAVDKLCQAPKVGERVSRQQPSAERLDIKRFRRVYNG
jgi:hypothetical protein